MSLIIATSHRAFAVAATRSKSLAKRRLMQARATTIYDPLHQLSLLARKPGTLRNGARLDERELPPAMRVQRKFGRMPNGDRPIVDIPGGEPVAADLRRPVPVLHVGA